MSNGVNRITIKRLDRAIYLFEDATLAGCPQMTLYQVYGELLGVWEDMRYQKGKIRGRYIGEKDLPLLFAALNILHDHIMGTNVYKLDQYEVYEGLLALRDYLSGAITDIDATRK